MRGMTISAFVLASVATGFSAVCRTPAHAGEGLVTRTFDVRDIVRTLPVAELPGGPGDRALIFEGYSIEDVLGNPHHLYYVGSTRRDEDFANTFFDGTIEERPECFFLPWARGGTRGEGDLLVESPGCWSLIEGENLARTMLEHLQALGFEAAECSLEWPRLRVQASGDALKIVESFLADLEREAQTQIAIEGILLSPEALSEIAPTWTSDGPFLPEGVFRKALLDPRSRLLSAVARSGQPVLTGSRAIRPLVVDSEVNQTGVIPVNNPVIEAPFAGDYLMACPILLPGAEAVWVDLSLGRLLVDAEQKKVGVDWGELDFSATRKRWISTSAVLEPGQVLVAGSIVAEDGLVALVRARVRKPPAGKTRSPISSHDLTLLIRQSGRNWPGRLESSSFWSNVPRLPCDLDLLRARLAAEGIEGHLSLDRARLVVSGSDDIRLGAFLSGELEEVCRLVAIEVGVWKLPRAEVVDLLERTEDGSLLPEGWEKAAGSSEARVDRYTVVGAAGQALGLFGATVKSFAVDVEQVSGGTGFAIIQVSDPIVRSAGDGTELWLQAAPTADPSRLRLTVGGLRTRIIEERAVVAALPTLEPTGTTSGAAVSSRGGSASAAVNHLWRIKEVTLTLPSQDVQCWSAEVEVPPGRSAILHVDARDGEDAATVLVGRVRPVR
ncbi:MAG: hypothetical protein JXA90_06685 [Planctomycetes bacterium]|nr:hypothetical protein [Planctomycetota bacterium]